jgi:hypothetical protein
LSASADIATHSREKAIAFRHAGQVTGFHQLIQVVLQMSARSFNVATAGRTPLFGHFSKSPIRFPVISAGGFHLIRLKRSAASCQLGRASRSVNASGGLAVVVAMSFLGTN